MNKRQKKKIRARRNQAILEEIVKGISEISMTQAYSFDRDVDRERWVSDMMGRYRTPITLDISISGADVDEDPGNIRQKTLIDFERAGKPIQAMKDQILKDIVEEYVKEPRMRLMEEIISDPAFVAMGDLLKNIPDEEIAKALEATWNSVESKRAELTAKIPPEEE